MVVLVAGTGGCRVVVAARLRGRQLSWMARSWERCGEPCTVGGIPSAIAPRRVAGNELGRRGADGSGSAHVWCRQVATIVGGYHPMWVVMERRRAGEVVAGRCGGLGD